MRMVTLDIGPIWKMQLLQTVLEERGVPSFLPDSNLKTLDPAITGTLAFDTRLEVPAERVVEARAALQEAEAELAELRRAPLEAGRHADELIQDEEPPTADFGEGLRLVEPPDVQRESLEEVGRRMRWSVLFGVTQPFAVLYAWRYFRALARGVPRPPTHTLNLAALALMVIFWVVLFEVVGVRNLF